MALRFSDSSTTPFQPPFHRISVIGGGAWGTALAMACARAGREVSLWAREAAVVEHIRRDRVNPVFLPGHVLPASIRAEHSLDAALQGTALVLLVVPSQFLRATCRLIARVIAPGTPLVICAKGIEHGSGQLLAQVVEDALPGHPLAVLSGPTFAHEVALGQPTAVTIASRDVATDGEDSLAARIAASVGSAAFRPYVSDDVVGVEVGGAVKNVLAIASGIAHGLGFGANARAALITRGLGEMQRLGEALGGRADTLCGLAGLGDLTLTCSSEQSRNMRYGAGIATGRSELDIFDGRPVVVEGRENAVPVTDLARQLLVDMPICEAVRAIVSDGAAVSEVMAQLLSRPFRAEADHIAVTITQPVTASVPAAGARA